MVHSDGGKPVFVEVGQYGHALRQEMDVVPLSEDDAVLYLRVFRYNRHIAHEEAGPLEETLTASARAVINAGVICDGRGCYSAQGGFTRQDAQEVYDIYLAKFPDRWDCTVVYPG